MPFSGASPALEIPLFLQGDRVKEHIEELWEEYKELTKRDGRGPEYFARKVELDHLRAAEAAESEPTIVYSVIDGGAIQLQNDEISIEDCNKAIELNPNGADAYNYRGVAYTDSKQYERAIEDFNKTIEFDPKNADAHNNRGVAYCFLGHYERAIEDFNKAMELNPNFIMAYSNRELALSKLEEKNSIPGFETIFAITGFLAVTYLFITHLRHIKIKPQPVDPLIF